MIFSNDNDTRVEEYVANSILKSLGLLKSRLYSLIYSGWLDQCPEKGTASVLQLVPVPFIPIYSLGSQYWMQAFRSKPTNMEHREVIPSCPAGSCSCWPSLLPEHTAGSLSPWCPPAPFLQSKITFSPAGTQPTLWQGVGASQERSLVLMFYINRLAYGITSKQ